MGGTVAVTIRRADGRTHRMARWTNPFSHVFLDLAFIEGDDSFWNEYIRQYEEGDFADKEPWTLTAPLSYGLIVVDYPSKTILHSQGYSRMDEVGFHMYLNDSICSGIEWPWPKIVDLSKSGRVSRQVWDTGIEARTEGGVVQSWEDEVDRQERIGHPDNMATYYPTDLSPWTIVRFGEDPHGIRAMQTRLIELDYEFTEQEQEAWNSFVQRIIDAYAEDDD